MEVSREREEMRIIDGDALIARLRKSAENNLGTIASTLCELVCNDIECEPEIKINLNDTMIRCRDCRHRPTGDPYEHDLEFPDDKCPCKCEDYWYSWMPNDDWYCANGERRTDE